LDVNQPNYTQQKTLPAAKINGCHMYRVLIADGAIISDATLRRCVISERSIICSNSELENALVLGRTVLKKLMGTGPYSVAALERIVKLKIVLSIVMLASAITVFFPRKINL
jgi:hypothetical protein